MYSAPSFSIGLNMPPTSLACSDSNRGVQMVFSQGPADSQKVQQMLQQRVKKDLADVDCRPSICTISHSGAAMESVESDLPENLQASVGLIRYHSAPGSFLASLAEDGDDIVPQVSSPEPDNELARFFSSDSSLTSESSSRVLQQTEPSQSIKTEPEQHLKKHNEYSRMIAQNSSHLKRSPGNIAGEDPSKLNHFPAILENGLEVSHNSFCSSQISMICQAQGPQSGRQLMDNSFMQNPVPYNPLDSSGERPGSSSPPAMKNTLVRHSSSPAGVLSQMATDMQGYPIGVMKGNMAIGNIVTENSSCGNMAVPNRLCHQVNFLRQSSSPASLFAQQSTGMDIPEIVGKLNMHMGHSSGEGLAKGNSDSASIMSGGQGYNSSLSIGSWEDGIMLPGNYEGMQNGTNFAARKRVRDLDEKMMPGLNLPDQLKGEAGSHVASALTNHQFNLYKSTASDIAIEKLLEDSVPCRIRAKRGCATHPRSIAERVRRTRISDRMRKLQELVPNMDRQTNTADMLDEAVEYVKFLQKQVQELSENRAKCDCSSRHYSDVNNKN